MKLLSKLLAVGALALAATAPAQAALSWTDIDSGSPLKWLYHSSNSSTSQYSSTFNLLNDGYNPATMHITSAKAWFAFADDNDSAYEYVDITLDNLLLINDAEVDGSHAAYDWRSAGLTGQMLFQLQDGVISYTVKLLNTHGVNDVWLKVAKLKAYGDYKQVPDASATVALMGLGLLGLAAARKRFR